MIDTPIERIYYATPVEHVVDLKESASKVYRLNGLPELTFFQDHRNKLLIVDDFSSEKKEHQKITQLFTRVSHHSQTSVIFVTQNLFESGLRTLSLNSHYIILFKNIRDMLQIKALGKQIFPGKTDFFMDVYKDATFRPYGYLIIDVTSTCNELFRLRTNIFLDENPRFLVYISQEHEHIRNTEYEMYL